MSSLVSWGPRQRVALGLKAPMLAEIRAHPGRGFSVHLAALKAEGRVRRGVRLSEAHAAVRALEAEGLIEQLADGGWTAR